MADKEEVPFEKLPLKEKIILTTSSGLTKHFRGLEMAGIMSKEETAKQIGRIKKLSAIASGEEPKEQ